MVNGYLGFTHRPGVDRIQKPSPVLMAPLKDIEMPSGLFRKEAVTGDFLGRAVLQAGDDTAL